MALHVTQCPSCESTFNTSARILDAAHGLVRCGACLSVFEADQHFVSLLPPASNDESEDLSPESVFISAPEDYFDPTRFLKRSDLQDYEEPDEVDESAATVQAEELTDPVLNRASVHESREKPSHQFNTSPVTQSDWQPVSSPAKTTTDNPGTGDETRLPESKTDRTPVPEENDQIRKINTDQSITEAVDVDSTSDNIFDLSAEGDAGLPEVASDAIRDSDFDVFATAPQVRVPDDKREEVHDSNFDVFESEEQDTEEPPLAQIEVHDSNFDIFGSINLDMPGTTQWADENYEIPDQHDAKLNFYSEVTILPVLDEQSEVMTIIKEALGEDPELDEDFPMEADSEEWYLEEDPEAETHFQEGLSRGEIIILPKATPKLADAADTPTAQLSTVEDTGTAAAATAEPSSDGDADSAAAPTAEPSSPGDTDSAAAPTVEPTSPGDTESAAPDYKAEMEIDATEAAAYFEADRVAGKVVILPQEGNVSDATVDNDHEQDIPDQVEPETSVVQPLVQSKKQVEDEARPDTDRQASPLLESEPAAAVADGFERDADYEVADAASLAWTAKRVSEPESMVENDHDSDDSPALPPAGEPPGEESKESIRARLQSTQLDEEEDTRQLSAENLRAVRVMDDTLEIEDKRVGKRIRRALGLTLLTLAILTGILGIFAWQRMAILSQDPALRPGYLAVCNLLGCQLPVYRNTALIQTENLVVRSHPTQPNALELTARFGNLARFEQPFPVIELQFRDLDNRLVESREFMPVEYLPEALRGVSNMPVLSPVQITLLLPDPGPTAVNYQLNFRAELSAR